MNETWAQISDLAFEAALAGYVVALVCYAIEFAAGRGGDVPADQVVGVSAGSAGRGGTSTLTRTGGNVGEIGAIGALPPRDAVGWGERFGRSAVVVTVVVTLFSKEIHDWLVHAWARCFAEKARRRRIG